MTDLPAPAAVTYASYLRIGELLDLQHPRTAVGSVIAEHDELLFITIHQVYELWFKQVLHELRGDQRAAGGGGVQRALESGDAFAALALLGRVLTILKTLVAQVDVLETMTPLQFASFRARLDSASGFQSAQFRELEAVLGRRDAALLGTAVEGDPAWDRVRAATGRPSMWGSYLRFLATQGYDVPAAALAEREDGDDGTRELVVAVYQRGGAAALVSERLVDLDEGLQEWRYRHVKMVERTIGAKTGTGGSSGAAYLAGTLFHPAFPVLWQARAQF